MVELFTDDVWHATAPLSFLGLRVGTRMTAVRLAGGDVLLHSPIALDAETKAALDAIGPVRHIVAPNLYHHLYAGAAKEHYPEARLYGSAKLQRKRRDLAFDADLADPAPWSEEVATVAIEGCMLGETALFHHASGTLLSADLIERFDEMDHFLTRTYLKLGGIWHKTGVSRPLRLAYRDRRASRASIDRLLELPIERISIAHGSPVVRDARESLRASYDWLR